MQCQLDDGNVYGLLSPFSHQTIFVHSPFPTWQPQFYPSNQPKIPPLLVFWIETVSLFAVFLCCKRGGRSVLLQPLQFYPPWEKLHHLLHLKCCCKFAEMFFTSTWQQARPRQPGGQYDLNISSISCLSNSRVMSCRRLLDGGQHSRVHHVACELAQKDDE